MKTHYLSCCQSPKCRAIFKVVAVFFSVAVSLSSLGSSSIPCSFSHNSLFKPRRGQVLNSGGESSNINDLSSSSQTASRPQTFLSQVTMVTEPPLLQLLTATVSQAVPPLSPSPPPPVGSSAASGRPLQQPTHAERQDKGTKRAFVPPMTPQPLSIPGAALHWQSQPGTVTGLPIITHVHSMRCFI